MIDVYDYCPKFENGNFIIRFVKEMDVKDLLKVYSDKNALPFFNSDNCNGDNFYYPDETKMKKAIDFWLYSYDKKQFVRWTIIDKSSDHAVGTIEMFHRQADDAFNDKGVLRIDLRSDYEKKEVILTLFDLFVYPAFDLFDCEEIISKIPNYAIERIAAAEKYGFIKSDHFLIGTHDHYAYNGYWTIRKQ